MSEVLIRTATPEDSEDIESVLRRAFAFIESEYTAEAFVATTPPAEVIRQRFKEDGTIWVAEVGGEIVGTVSCVPEDGRLYIRSMAVLPEHRGLGIAGKLLALIESYAAECGFEKMFLFTTNVLTGAIRLYEKNGFRKIRDAGPEEFFGTPGIEMEKRLEIGVNKQNVVGS